MHNLISKTHSRRSGFCALVVSFVLFGITTLLVYSHLPEHMASHFNGSGRANGYLSPAVNMTFLLGGCVTFVAVFGAMWYGLRQINPASMNLPDTARWKDLGQRVALRNKLADSMLWLAAASVAWMAGVLQSLYRANLPGARGLGAEFWIYTLVYFVFMLVWPLLPLFGSESD